MRLLLVIGTFVAFGIALASLRSRAQELSTVERVDRLVVNKSEHSMEAYDQGRLVAQYRVAVGGGRLGPKLYEGDRRTPEGRYRIDGRHRSRHFHRFLHVSYPNRDDRRRHRAARRHGSIPTHRGIGGSIGLHGSPQRGLSTLAPNVRWNWTDGCIAVTNDEIEVLYRAVIRNAIIEIRP
ncbi:MAG: L,D-transpeptidase family protein [Myxococcota bacterium]